MQRAAGQGEAGFAPGDSGCITIYVRAKTLNVSPSVAEL